MNLMAHQHQAVEWLSKRPKAFLALEPGLGKTAVACVDCQGKVLVVCPSSLKLNWAAEMRRWRPDLTLQVVSSKSVIDESVDVLIANYDILHKLSLPSFDTLIVDESHYAKSLTARRTKSVVKLTKSTARVRLLSGTPIVNRPIELWPLANAIGLIKLPYYEYGMRFCAGWSPPWMKGKFDFSGCSNEQALRKFLEPGMLRMSKTEVLKDLPPKIWNLIELSAELPKVEKQFLADNLVLNEHSLSFEAISDIRKLNTQMKMPMAIEFIENALREESKVVVFAHHTEIICELATALSSYSPVMVTGSVSTELRHQRVNQFQEEPACRVFIGNIAAAGVGLTLTAASRVIFVEAPWTPAELEQAADRCHRIGQKSTVVIDVLTISESIDHYMLSKILEKQSAIENILPDYQPTLQNSVQSNLHQPERKIPMNTQAIALKLRELADLFEANAEKESAPLKLAGKMAEPIVMAEPESTTAPEASIDDVREALAKLIAADKRDKAVDVLNQHGVKKIAELQPSQFSSVVAACTAPI